MIKAFKRDTCRLCGSPSLSKVLKLEPVPIGEKYSVERNKQFDARFPIDLYECQDCLCVQTLDGVDSEFLWSDYTYFSGQTSGIVEHQNDFAAKTLEKYPVDDNFFVFDIGSNDGTLLKAFRNRGCQVFGVDPADTVASVANASGIQTHIGLFSDKEMENFPSEFQRGFASIVTAFNVFAHSDDMQGMIDGVIRALAPNGVFIFEVQYLKDILEKKLLGTIFHEHMIHYSVTSAEKFLERNGLKLIDAETNSIQKGSIIFTATGSESTWPTNSAVAELKKREHEEGCLDQSKFREFTTYIEATRLQVRELVDEARSGGNEVAGYGAARSGPTLAIQLGLVESLSYLVDDHPSKVGKYAAFESLEVKSGREFQERAPSHTFILAWLHYKNIIANNLDYLKKGGKFVLLWPEVTIVSYDNYSLYIN